MILQSLVEYYEALAARGEIAAPGWSLERVSFALNLSAGGELLGVIPLKHEEQRGSKTVEVPQKMLVPERVTRSSGVRANFLCDNAAYLLGIDSKGKPELTRKCFEACAALHAELLKDCSGAAARAVAAFFAGWQPSVAAEHPALCAWVEALATANLVFCVDGGPPVHEDPEIRAAWEACRAAAEEGERMRCLVTGRVAPAARVHASIKGIAGAQSSGATLVGFNANAYESYGKQDAQGLNAPVSRHAAFAYVTALNHLIADRARTRTIGDTTVVYWAEQADPAAPALFRMSAWPEANTDADLAGVMRNLAQGLPVADIDMQERFYVLGLAPNAARVSVRFFLQDSFGAMLNNLRLHYNRLDIVRPAYDGRLFLSVADLLAETVNPHSREKVASPLLSGAVMRSVLTGAPYPHTLFTAVMTRIRADRDVTRGRAAIIKAVLQHNYNENEVTTMALNPDSNNRAYVLGRLFAVLEDTQKQANPGINTTIKDRYFTSACATPGSVFPQLLKLSSFHAAKAEYGQLRERDKAELMDRLEVEENPFPAHLSLQEQGVFMLGYYHQTQARYQKKEENKNVDHQ